MAVCGRWWKCVVAIALVTLMQGPALVTQEIAWAGMLVRYTQERGLVRGVAETFDGDHPCAMCLKAEKLREEERGDQEPLERRSGKVKNGFSWSEMAPQCGYLLPRVRVLRVAPAWGTMVVELRGRGRELPSLPPPECIG